MPFMLRNLKEDLVGLRSRFDGAPDLEFASARRRLQMSRTSATGGLD